MKPRRTFPLRRVAGTLLACGVLSFGPLVAGRTTDEAYDPLLSEPGGVCGPALGGQSAAFKALLLAKADKAKLLGARAKAPDIDVPLYRDLGPLVFKVSTQNAKAQAYFDQGLRLAFAFNHAEALRAFQAAQKLDPTCAMCFWGEALVLGPNINVPMMPEANAPALAALAKAVALKGGALTERERALIEALDKRYSADPKAERPALDAAYADAMKSVAARFPADDTILSLVAEAAMDTQPWDYWEAGGTRPKGRGEDIVGALETVLKRNGAHPGAIHLYIHAMEASTRPEKALPYARRLAALVPGAGHLVHMPAHIYYRVGMYRESLAINQRAVEVDERYFKTSPSDPLYKAAYYPHNIHFVMVSAQMGGDGKTALDAAGKLDASVPGELVKQFAILQPIKAAPYAAHVRFSEPAAVLQLPAPSEDLVLVNAMYHYALAVAHAARKDAAAAQKEIDTLAKIETTTDFKAFEAWGIPAKEIVQSARLVASGRLADAKGDLDGAAKAYESAIAVEDTLPYTEPPYWYYPVRQSLASVRLRQGQLDAAEKAFRDSLARVRNNAWALAGLIEVEHKKGDAKAEKAARRAYERAWLGPKAGPDLARL
ncbi:tetratricopeptide repeat protein [Piscinibacter sp.]|jgi:tetratricopeptide (TPR) repeat protein|uniref:tetratricopeptide repeat protein n=1 Tax=Piscinibacter sp. TaxID=1903157 RepID=UPI002F3FFD1B